MNVQNDANGQEPYVLREPYSSMTLHHMYGLTEQFKEPTVDTFLLRHEFAFIADLVAQGFSTEEVEEVVNSKGVLHAPWPEQQRLTDFFWIEGEDASRLADLSRQAVELCFGQDEQSPIGGNFVTVGAAMGSQQLALAGLIHAREHGLLREITKIDEGAGPLYVVRGSFSDKMFKTVFPEE